MKINDKGSVRVFVYGTLKRGLGNYITMQKAGGQFMGFDHIEGNFKLAEIGGLPAVVPDLTKTNKVYGQLFCMDEEGLAVLDLLEGHPNFYTRSKIRTESRDKRAWVYFMQNRDWINGHSKVTDIDNNIYMPSDNELAYWKRKEVNG